ncbi:hypothetical protein [Corynebacterium cystitidis]|uniref:hypothetical protein n=1 Tax=Corynebacterium cystitidis TaxID=35757 RepID=UPI00211E1545|nr:hypothetical protein [Corynebacterium cystitidis]
MTSKKATTPHDRSPARATAKVLRAAERSLHIAYRMHLLQGADQAAVKDLAAKCHQLASMCEPGGKYYRREQEQHGRQ